MKKIFLFDIGGVIIEGHDLKMIYEGMDCTCSYEEFYSIFRESKLYYDHEYGLLSTDRYLDTLKSYTGSKIEKEAYLELHHRAKGKYYDSTRELIEYIKSKGYKIGILSNLKKIDVQYFFDTYYTDHFDYEFYSCFNHCMKPSDKIYKEVADITNTEENEVYFFDDLEENCEAARKYGIKAICTTGENIIENFKKYVGEI